MVVPILKINPGLVDRLHDRDAPEVADLYRTLADYGAQLGEPTGTVGESRQYFPVTGVPRPLVDEVLERLRQVKGVEAAYLKPADEPP